MSVTLSIFAKYVWLEHFPISAYFNIGATFTFSLFQIGLAATDLAFTDKDQGTKDFLFAMWIISYWGVILCGSVLMQFYKLYWASGRFSIRSKVIFVLKTLLFKILIMIGVLAVCFIVLIRAYGESLKESA